MPKFEDRDFRRWIRVPLGRLRGWVAGRAGRCRVSYVHWGGGDGSGFVPTTYLWSQPHGEHCGVIGWRSVFAVYCEKS